MNPKKETSKNVAFNPEVAMHFIPSSEQGALISEKQTVPDIFSKVRRFAMNVHRNIKISSSENVVNRKEAVKKIAKNFVDYLDKVQKENVDWFNNSPEKEKGLKDTYYALMVALSDNKPINDERYVEKYSLNFSEKGWPIDSDDPHFKQWCVFIRNAVEVFRKAIPVNDLSAWVGLDEHVNSPHSGTSEPNMETEESSQGGLDNSEHSMPSEEILSDNDVDTLITKAPQLEQLILSIKAMYVYGCELKEAHPKKSQEAMSLAITLFKDIEKHHRSGEFSKKDKEDFLVTLHSKDPLMSSHRQYWKVIVGNIALALTGIGLVAIGISLLATRHAFFSRTQSQQNIDKIHQQFANTNFDVMSS